MKDCFRNKRIVFLGDSITEDGGFCYHIRAYLREQGERAVIFNRGVGGTRAVMAKYMLEEEVFPLHPDIVFVSYGVNDIGVWLYDAREPQTSERLLERQRRDEEYLQSMKDLVSMLREKGITPICCTPFAVDERLAEKEEVETIADNKEKAEYIASSFYTRKTFAAINEGLRGYAERIISSCAESCVDVIDLFNFTYRLACTEGGIFIDDGTHYTKRGHEFLAKFILKFMGFSAPIGDFRTYPDMDEAKETEKLLRDIMLYRRGTMLPEQLRPKTTHADVIAFLKENLGNREYWAWEKIPAVLENYDRKDELVKREIALVTAL